MITLKEKTKVKFAEHLALKEKSWKLKKAAEFSDSLDEHKEANFLQNLQETINQKACEYLSVPVLEKAAMQMPIILGSGVPYLYKLIAIETFLSEDFIKTHPELYGKIKKIIIEKGDIELYRKIADVLSEQFSSKELSQLGENALKSGSFSDAQEAFSLAENDDGLQKAKEIEKEKTVSALEKMQKMPRGLKTNGLMMHRTEYKFIENILEVGVLSLVQQFQKYGIHPEKKKEPFNHGLRGSYDYVSVTDPWYGSETSSDFIALKQEMREAIKKEIKPFMVEMKQVSYDEKECKELAEQYFAIWQEDSKPADFYITFEAAIHPKWQKTMAKIENIFEQYSEVKIDANKTEVMRYPEGKSSQKINLNKVFIPDRGGIGLLLDPRLKRFSTLSGGCNFESLVKKNIQPQNIVGILVGNDFFSELEEERSEDIMKHMTKIAQQNGLPLCSVSAKKEINLIWPKK